MLEKRVKNFGRGLLPPLFWAMPDRKHFFLQEGFPNSLTPA